MTTQTEHAPFPSDETLAAYIDGRLDDETRKRVVEHIADCPECFEAVQVSNEMTSTATVVRYVHWPRNAVFGLATAAALAAIFFLTPLGEQVWPHDDLGALAKVAPPTRKIDGRLTGFPHQRLKRMRGVDEKRDTEVDLESLAFYSVAADVQKRAMKHPTARTLHAEGVSLLELADSKEEIDTAIDRLEKARQSSRQPDAQLLSDLAAAYVANGNYAAALQAANQAWALSKTPEIAWNRAMAAQYLGEHRDEAIAAWKDYLKINDSPNWAEEARAHLEQVQSR